MCNRKGTTLIVKAVDPFDPQRTLYHRYERLTERGDWTYHKALPKPPSDPNYTLIPASHRNWLTTADRQGNGKQPWGAWEIRDAA